MRYPRISDDPHRDADARDMWLKEQDELKDKVRCHKCKHFIEEGEEFLEFDDVILCEYCVSDLMKVKVY